MKKLSSIIAVATLVLMTIASPALASRGHSDHTVPFKGSVLALDNGQIFPPFEEEPVEGCLEWAEWQFFSRGTGQVSHLGRSDLDLIQCSRFVNDAGDGYSEGRASFTAANGDMLVLTYDLDWKSYVTDFGAPDGFDGAGTWTVLEGEGSGRFADATGSGMIEVIGDIPFDDTPMFGLPPGGTLWTFDGMIAYDASSRSRR